MALTKTGKHGLLLWVFWSANLPRFIREPAEYATIDEIYNPAIHRINHAIKQRAVYPEKPVPEIPPVLLRFAAPPTELVETIQATIDSLIKAADVKKGEHTFPPLFLRFYSLIYPQCHPKLKVNAREKLLNPSLAWTWTLCWEER